MNALSRLERMPDWPARMTAPIAALYMGISETTFLERFGDRGVKEGGSKLWARAQLDQLVAKQFRLQQPSTLSKERDDSWDDLR